MKYRPPLIGWMRPTPTTPILITATPAAVRRMLEGAGGLENVVALPGGQTIRKMRMESGASRKYYE